MIGIILVIVLAAAWMGSLVFSGKLKEALDRNHEDGTSYIPALAILIVFGAAGAVILYLIKDVYGFFWAAGTGLGIVMVFSPFDATAEKAKEIGDKAKREDAIKEQMKEQKKEREAEMRENAKAYAEAKRAAEARDRRNNNK